MMRELCKQARGLVDTFSPSKGLLPHGAIQIVEWMNTIIVNGFEGGTLRKVPPTNSGSGGPSRHTVSGNAPP